MKYLGVTTTEIIDGATISSVIIDEKSVTAQKGDFVIYQELEFIYNGSKWQELGDPTAKGLGDLAYKDIATATYTPSGSVSAPTFTGAETNISIDYTPTDTISKPTFSGSSPTITVS